MSAWTFDDGGRAAAGFKGDAGDCVCRAFSIAAQRPYADVYRELAEIQGRMPQTAKRKAAGKRSARNGIYTRSALFERWIEAQGWTWTPTMAIGQGCKVHLLASELPAGRLIVSVSKHVVAVVDGLVRDTHDCTRGGTRCVYGYWSKQASGVPIP